MRRAARGVGTLCVVVGLVAFAFGAAQVDSVRWACAGVIGVGCGLLYLAWRWP